MFSAYFVFHYLNMFYVEKQVSEFFATQLATRQSQNLSRKFIQKLWQLTCESRKFSRLNIATCPVAKRPEIAFKGLFRGKPVLNLSHPLLNPSFTIFTSKLNQFEWFSFH